MRLCEQSICEGVRVYMYGLSRCIRRLTHREILQLEDLSGCKEPLFFCYIEEHALCCYLYKKSGLENIVIELGTYVRLSMNPFVHSKV